MSTWSKMAIYSDPDVFPEDIESSDKDVIKEIIEKSMNETYPPFNPEMVHTMSKDYYLPALKVLERDKEGKLYSPQKESEWVDMELQAECKQSDVSPLRIVFSIGGKTVTDFTGTEAKHQAPDESCDCGIYGSVNLEEVAEYLMFPDGVSQKMIWSLGRMNGFNVSEYTQESRERVLCIIEPSENAKVIVCRKGWKASKAFVSEIIGETMSESDASYLLSMAWHRNIDIRSMYENR